MRRARGIVVLLVTLAMLLHGTMRALPEEEDDSASVGAAFREYWMLAAAALCFHAGLWVDKIVLYVNGTDGAPTSTIAMK